MGSTALHHDGSGISMKVTNHIPQPLVCQQDNDSYLEPRCLLKEEHLKFDALTNFPQMVNDQPTFWKRNQLGLYVDSLGYERPSVGHMNLESSMNIKDKPDDNAFSGTSTSLYEGHS
ncbi:unnamed protein product [Protopolystoma xenopodis]|uniref:Uncharacterized protein n=1 Tax=Protopolystoma xenopodis TaxID=117903 RepID=A0A448XLL4_9PLAT|nr:unnamed protein product [Protopolystoma xenopodis]